MPPLIKFEPGELASFRRKLLRWYKKNQRELPWRRGRDPYRIWLSEIMLQQTRVAAVVPYYERFLGRFPTVKSLARSRRNEVLKSWAGLGYYSRARNLHDAAKGIIAKHDARFPRRYSDALALPGIGRYTAAAILSIAYGKPLAVLDGNVARVLARLGAVRGELHAPQRWRALAESAQTLLAHRSPGDWNQAMMELGATVCTPRTPQCSVCPLAKWCRAHALGIEDQLPAKRRERPPVKVTVAAAIAIDPRGRALLVNKPGRHDGVLFSRMWQFPAVEVRHDAVKELTEHLVEVAGLRPNSLAALPSARHSVTFRNLTLLPFLARLERLPSGAGFRAVAIAEVPRLAVSSATKKIAKAALLHY